MNTRFRKNLPGTALDYFDAREAVDALQPGAWATLPYTARVHAENLVRRADPAQRDDYLCQLIERRTDLDFPWYPVRVVCHDILGQTALVDLAGLRDAIAQEGGDPAAGVREEGVDVSCTPRSTAPLRSDRTNRAPDRSASTNSCAIGLLLVVGGAQPCATARPSR